MWWDDGARRCVCARVPVLTRYWFQFVAEAKPSALALGCGLTGYNLDDAKAILRQEVFSRYGERQIKRVIEGVDVWSLDEARVRPHVKNPAVRGIWYPVPGRSGTHWGRQSCITGR
jgi:hypothetical protein